jgi:transcriptional regulator with XRE-family HTH domain
MKAPIIQIFDRIKELREKRSLTQVELAEKAGINPSTLSRILNKERDFKPEYAISLAKALEVTVYDILLHTEYEDFFNDWVEKEVYNTLQKQYSDLGSENKNLQIQLDGKSAEIESLTKSIESYIKKLSELEKKNSELIGELGKIEEMHLELSSLREDNSRLSAENTRSLVMLEGTKNQNQILASQLNTLSQQISVNNMRINSLINELNSMKGTAITAGIISGISGFMIGKSMSSKKS